MKSGDDGETVYIKDSNQVKADMFKHFQNTSRRRILATKDRDQVKLKGPGLL